MPKRITAKRAAVTVLKAAAKTLIPFTLNEILLIIFHYKIREIIYHCFNSR